jgi:glycerol-3-phosphate cytidylyltransferase
MNIFNFFTEIKRKNALWKENEISSLLKNGETVLDFGCGDLLFASKLKEKNKSLKITGVDVVNSHSLKGIRFVKYKGDKLPFEDGTFDTVVSVYVFHHCINAEAAFKECLRVAKKRVIFIEAIARNKSEILPMKIMDWFFNVWKPEPIPLTFQFNTLSRWKKIFKKAGLKIGIEKKINNPIAVFPIGRAYLFEVKKQNLKNTKKSQKKVVYIGGTFDLIHHGHIELFKYAKKIADVVVVSLNTDEFNLQYKGRRPVMSLEERMAVVSACKYVDRVDVNEGGKNSKPAILRNKPNYILHGEDWKGEPFMRQLGLDQKFLIKNNIELVYAPLVKGISSTELKKRTRSKSRKQDKAVKEIKSVHKISHD